MVSGNSESFPIFIFIIKLFYWRSLSEIFSRFYPREKAAGRKARNGFNIIRESFCVNIFMRTEKIVRI
jgi:hypothetical protein